MRAVLVACCVWIPGSLLADWTDSDVPIGLMPAGAAIEGPEGTWTLEGSGVDIWGTSDEFHYLYDDLPRGEPFSLGCRVRSLGATPNQWGKAGLMVRAGLPEFAGPESYGFLCATTGNGVCLQWRDGFGAGAAWDAGTGQWRVGPEDVWLRLVREGGEIRAYAALERPLWRSLGSYSFGDPEMAMDVHVGLALTSHDAASLAVAEFDEVDLEAAPISETGPTDLAIELDGDAVALTWTSLASYDEIVVFRESQSGELTRIEPGPGPTDTSMSDEPGDGAWRYWISAVEDGAECLGVASPSVIVGDLGYSGEVLLDAPVAYWRLGEETGATARAIGSAGAAVDGTYVGGLETGHDSLLPRTDDPCVLFDGLTSQVLIPDHASINSGGPYAARSVELWFLAEEVSATRAVLFEEGGNTRGISIYVVEEAGEPSLYMNAWNQSEEVWGPLAVRAPIEAGEVYHAVMVVEASQNATLGDFDGRITGYLNGEEFDTVEGADQLYSHGDDGCIGAIQQNTRYHDGTTQASGAWFWGFIDEVAIYGTLLDDPDGDGDRTDSRVEAHYEAAFTVEPVTTFRRADTNADGKLNITDAVSMLNFLFLGGPAPTCEDAADTDDSGRLNITDAVSTLNHLFLGGPEPPAPSAACGTDPTDDDLGCEAFAPCR